MALLPSPSPSRPSRSTQRISDMVEPQAPPYIVRDTVEPQILAPDARNTAISWTGGKDCNLALLDAWRNPQLHVTSLVVFRPPDAIFRAHPLTLAEAQAESLGLPLLHVLIPNDAPDFKAAYVAGMRNLLLEHGIEVIATGDMDLIGSMQRNWIQECGEEAGIDAYLPLWQAERGACLRRLLAENFVVVFSCVKSPWFSASWIGRRLDASTLELIEAMAAAAPTDGAKPLDLGGERGEYHTMVLDGPLYARPVHVEGGAPAELEGQPGQKAGERWWTLKLARRLADP